MHFLIAFTLTFGQNQRPPDRWFAVDKTKHFLTAAFVQSVSFSALRSTRLSHGASMAGATAVAATVSIGKEIVDARGSGTPSAKDLTWDAAGMATAAALLNQTQR
jgi:uncharacterized protein YfiM (DUF2279 family)